MQQHFRVLGLITLLATQLGTTVGWADERPNIVVILCDDLGYGDLECYGHPHIKTPHLNQLATEGILFTDFYSAAPVCSPSRVGLLTGRSPNRAGVYDWIPAASSPRVDAREQVHMRVTEVTIPFLLKQAGYDTCMSGKWHCNSMFNNKAQPQPGDFGFDHWLATQNNAAPTHENPKNFVRNGKPIGDTNDFSCHLVVDEAVGWLKTSADRDNPFFVFMAFHEPHEPVASPEELVSKYLEVAETRDEAQYFANVENVDRAVGRFLSALDKMKLRDNTLIVFTSDNGPETLKRYRGANRSYGRPTPLKGMKLHTHDAGFRVAGIVNWTGQIEGGQISSTPVSSLDFLPTFCRLAKTTPPKSLVLDGIDCIPAFQQRNLSRPKPLVWAYFNAINEARVAMRHGQWKVLAQLNGGKLSRMQNITTLTVGQVKEARLTDFEIYDMHNDVSELNNRALSDPELLRALSKLLNAEYDDLVNASHTWTPNLKPRRQSR